MQNSQGQKELNESSKMYEKFCGVIDTLPQTRRSQPAAWVRNADSTQPYQARTTNLPVIQKAITHQWPSLSEQIAHIDLIARIPVNADIAECVIGVS